MGTECLIGMTSSNGLYNGNYKVISCHWDGYPAYMASMLTRYYSTQQDVKELLNLGDISSLHKFINPGTLSHSFDHPEPNVTVAYIRDDKRDPEEYSAKLVPIEYLLNYDSYVYIFDADNNVWMQYLGTAGFVRLRPTNSNESYFRVDDIVVVTAEHPDGSDVTTKGQIGIVTNIELEDSGETSYTVKSTAHNSYLYSGNQLRDAKPLEIRNEFMRILKIQ